MENEASDSGDEEGYACNPRQVPVYERKKVHLRQSHNESHSHVRVAAPEFHPVCHRAEPDNLETYAQHPQFVMPKPAQVTDNPLPFVEPQEKLDDCRARRSDEDTDLGAQQQPANVEDVILRRSTRAVKPKEVFTYNQIGQPTYQAWRPGANVMHACVLYPVQTYPVLPDIPHYPIPAVWAF